MKKYKNWELSHEKTLRMMKRPLQLTQWFGIGFKPWVVAVVKVQKPIEKRRDLPVVRRGCSSISYNLDCAEQLSRVVKSCSTNSTCDVKKTHLDSLNSTLHLVHIWKMEEKSLRRMGIWLEKIIIIYNDLIIINNSSRQGFNRNFAFSLSE